MQTILAVNRIKYRDVDISMRQDQKEFMYSKSPHKFIPQLFINGEFKAVSREPARSVCSVPGLSSVHVSDPLLMLHIVDSALR